MLAVAFDPVLGEGDLSIVNQACVEGAGVTDLATLVQISLFCDAPAQAGDGVAATTPRAGYWADAFEDRDTWGSRLWTLDRAKLVNATVATVERNLAEGALLVAAALFLLLGNWRAAIIAVLVIPFSFLMMATGMNIVGVPGNLMSLGALDFGLIVDGAVIIIENCLARLAHRQEHEGRLLSLRERLEETMRASQEMIKPTVFGQAIILLAFAPLLMFTGVEGKTFSPMAITIMLALAAAFVLAITLVPALVALLIRGKVAEKEVWLIRKAKERYLPLLDQSLERPWRFIAAGLAFFLAAVPAFGFLGSEFIPQLDEKNLALASTRVPSVSLEQSLTMQRAVETAVTRLPEVALMFSKTGTAEVATDPMPGNISDGFVILKPQDEWKSASSQEELVTKFDSALAVIPGLTISFTQPYSPGNRDRLSQTWYRLAIIAGKGIAFAQPAGTPTDFGTDGGTLESAGPPRLGAGSAAPGRSGSTRCAAAAVARRKSSPAMC
mgnify:CR=1 FL=1